MWGACFLKYPMQCMSYKAVAVCAFTFRAALWGSWGEHRAHSYSRTAILRHHAAYPWYTTVRVILDDPDYKDWFVGFVPGGSFKNGSWFSSPCDANNKTLCSDRYHAQARVVLPLNSFYSLLRHVPRLCLTLLHPPHPPRRSNRLPTPTATATATRPPATAAR